MQKKQRKVIIQNFPLSENKDKLFSLIKKEDIVLTNTIKKYVEESLTDDVEIFFEEGNCIVTNLGYHFADDISYRTEKLI